MDFQENYSHLSDDELLSVAGDRRDLVQEAALALDSEMARRGLSYQKAYANKREITRLEIKEARRHRPSTKGSKYFVSQMSGWMILLLISGELLLMVPLMIFHWVQEEWAFAILLVWTGALIGVSAVQPWLRRTRSFWLSLVVSCAVQLFAGHWISAHFAPRSRNEMKGAGFLAMFAGYLVGALLFLLLQKLKPQKDSN
jgi:hypothetical protein